MESLGTALPRLFRILSLMFAVPVNAILSYSWFGYGSSIFSLVSDILEPLAMFSRDASSAAAGRSFNVTYKPEMKREEFVWTRSTIQLSV